MPKLKFVLDSLEGLDEATQGLYTKRDNGKFYIDTDVDPDALAEQAKAARIESMNRRKDLEKWAALGLSPDEIAELKKEKTERENKDAEKKGEWEKLKEQMVAQHNKEKETLTAKEQALQKKLRNVLIDNAALSAITSEKGSPDLLLPIVHKLVDLVEENGEFSVRVLDEKGDPRVNSKGEFLTIPDLVKEFKSSTKFGRAFEATGKGGSGADPASARQSGGTGGSGPLTRSKMSVQQKAEYMREHGKDAYRALPLT